MLRAFVLFLLFALAAPASAQSAAGQAKLLQTTERGRLLFEVDRAAWVTTDDLLERAKSSRGRVGIKGWVVERDGRAPGGYVVTYYGNGPAGPVALYSGRVRDNKVSSGELYEASARPALTAAQLRLRSAVEAARASEAFRPCTAAPFNIAAIPPAAPDEPIDVYLLSAQTKAKVFPLGGHYLLRFAYDGKLLSSRRFMNTCMNLDTAAVPKGGEPVAVVVTHLLDPLPTEIHVFMAMIMSKPIMVATSDGPRIWTVTGAGISPMRR